MVFVGVYRALYDYTPNAQNELPIKEGDILFILEKSTDDDWWKAKKKAEGEDEEEPEGLVPNNYIEEAPPVGEAKALYDYSRQTDEELSFAEDATLEIYDASDPDWTLVGRAGEFGFAPANYIEISEEPPPKPARPSPTETRSIPASLPSPEPASPTSNPAATLAGIIQQKTGGSRPPPAPQFTPEASDDDEGPAPSLPRRPPSQSMSPPQAQYPSPRSPEPRSPEPRGLQASPPPRSPGNYHLYNIHEMISHQGKNRKMPTTLGINVPKGIIMIAPEKSRDGPQKEWTAEKMTHYSIEGKHVFMELVKPSKSIDFHAGAKDTAQEIVAHLGELAGAARAEGLREVLEAGASGGQRTGVMLYDFMAQGDDEVTVAVGDQVIVLDDTQSEEWWNVRRLKNGKEGVVPSSYVELTGNTTPAPIPTPAPAAPTRSFVEQNRMEEERLARESAKSAPKREQPQEVGSGVHLPRRSSSLHQADDDSKRSSQKSKRETRSSRSGSVTKQKPNPALVRTWTDRSGNFKVDAQFLGLKDNKIHLHKTNGVKIAVQVGKMSVEDLEYVEQATGESLDEDKPLSDIKRRSTQRRNHQSTDRTTPKPVIAIEKPPKPKFDWFDFFLQCGVDPQICQRYATNFDKDQMGEENMQDIEPHLLRTLGLKEGDILRVTKYLDSKYGRVRERKTNGETDDAINGENGGIFSGPGGALRNNTRKGRPAPAVQTSDTVDPRAFEQESIKKDTPTDATATPLRSVPAPQPKTGSGFDDNAWDVKPSKQQPTPSTTSPPPSRSAITTPPPQQRPAPTGALAELSLLSPPLQPSPAPQPAPTNQSQPVQASSPPPQNQQATATRAVFDQMAQPGQLPAQPQQTSAPRQRPQPPQQQQQNSLLPPPPSRPMSAPQNNQPSAFGPPPLQPQMTGYQGQQAPLQQGMNGFPQQYQQQPMQAQPTGYGFGQQQQGMNGFQQFPQQQPQQNFGGFIQTQPTGFQQQPQQFLNGQQTSSPFADPPRQPFQPQPTGFQSQQAMQPQQTGINAFLPPALQPQPTGFGGLNGYNGLQQQQQAPPPVPPLPTGMQPQPYQQQQQPQQTQQQQQPAPLQPQKTGPAPPVRFGVQDAQPLQAQPTGKRANLAMATASNPFGF